MPPLIACTTQQIPIRWGLLVLMLGLVLSGEVYAQEQTTLVSPNERIEVTFALDEQGAPMYAVRYDGQPVIHPSPLGLIFSESGPLSSGMTVTGTQRDRGDETYRLVVGPSEEARARYNELTVDLEEEAAPGRRLRLVFRAYNEGAAFRYVIPEQSALERFEIASEQSTFALPEQAEGWALQLESYTTSYEEAFVPTPICDIAAEDIVGLPLTITIPNGPAVAITEARLTDYAGMYLSGADDPARPSTLVSELAPLPADSTVAVRAAAPHRSPWRVVMMGETPGDLIESNLVLHLNRPLALADTSWIQPGKTAWDWWSGRVVEGPNMEGLPVDTAKLYADPQLQRDLAHGRMNSTVMKHYIDLADDFDFAYMLIDASWYGDFRAAEAKLTTTIPEIDIPELVDYADERDVGLLLWVNWEPLTQQMEEAYQQYEEWGIRGVKIDYMNRDDQEMVNFYHRAVQKAAEHKLVVDFHGAYKPTGLRRTYPNLLTREGVLGLEFAKWSDRITPEHNVTIPFTRMLAGPMDYTPGAFDNVAPEQFTARYFNPMAMGTRCHQLAMYVVYESPMQMVSDHPSTYRDAHGADFLKQVPASWEETDVLVGEIGDYVAIARRKGEDWFIGAMTDGKARTLTLPLDFLEEGVRYQATVYQDDRTGGNGAKDVRIRTVQRTSANQLEAKLAPGGGYAVHLSPAQ